MVTSNFNYTEEINGMIDVMKATSDLLNKETALLREFKVSEAETLNQEKVLLTRQMEIFQSELKEKKHLLKTLPDIKKHELEVVGVELSKAMEMNQQQLFKVREINKRVVQVIANEAARQLSSKSGYNSNGQNRGGLGAYSPTPAMSYSEVI